MTKLRGRIDVLEIAPLEDNVVHAEQGRKTAAPNMRVSGQAVFHALAAFLFFDELGDFGITKQKIDKHAGLVKATFGIQAAVSAEAVIALQHIKGKAVYRGVLPHDFLNGVAEEVSGPGSPWHDHIVAHTAAPPAVVTVVAVIHVKDIDLTFAEILDIAPFHPGKKVKVFADAETL